MPSEDKYSEYRRSDQFMLPVTDPGSHEGEYNIYPSFRIDDHEIFTGFESLADRIKNYEKVIIDGFGGVFFDIFQSRIERILAKNGFNTKWINTSEYFKPESKVKEICNLFLGNNDPLFGKKTSLNLYDFFIPGMPESIRPDPSCDINLVIGPGAALCQWDALLVYIDIPKNEIQYRSRAGSITNLGMKAPDDPRYMYKRFYFIDWVVLNMHKKQLIKSIDLFVDGQRPELPVWMEGGILRKSLHTISRNFFRVRPWFEPGAWGGSWIKNNIKGLNNTVLNYAWSFELITPENGIIMQSSSIMCEVSFDCLMYEQAEAVLGHHFSKYGFDFPIRFDFLDTFDGGNLSLQCHPRPDYIKEHFGEQYTQEETYYILDSKDNASVYLGFRENCDPIKLRDELEVSQNNNVPFDADMYIMKHPVRKHDLLLIPYGTIHGSGKNNLVLEISTTPYIYTFKMYDWLRPDLDGKPRTLNISRGMENLFHHRKGNYVTDNLIAKPVLVEEGAGWKLFSLKTHESHSYEIFRYHFLGSVDIKTNNKCLVMNLTEGSSIEIETYHGLKKCFNYAETFVIPAAAERVKIYNKSLSEAILVKASLK